MPITKKIKNFILKRSSSYNLYKNEYEKSQRHKSNLESDNSFSNTAVTELINSNKLKIHPNVHMHISDKSNLIFNSILEIGSTWEGRPYNISSLRIFDDGILNVQGKFRINTGANITIYPSAKLEFGSGYSNNNLKIDCNTEVTIKNKVFIGSDVIIKDGDGHVINNNLENVSKPIIIENNVWIADRAIILKGVKIGSGSVVAAGAVVTRDVPKNSLVAGVPAKVIKEDIEWS